MNFTASEKTLLVKHTKEIFKYLETQIASGINDSVCVKFEDDPHYHKLCLVVYPDKEIKMYRNAIGSTVYKLGSDYDSKYTQEHSGCDIYKSYDEMFHLIKNWKTIKKEFLSYVDETQSSLNLLNNFTI